MTAEELFLKGRELLGEEKYAEAYTFYLQSAKLGYADACTMLGILYANALGVEQDYEMSIYWYQKGADKGDAYACFNLGLLALYGKGMSVDYDKGFKYARQSAEGGHDEGYWLLGVCYRLGYGTEIDLEQAEKYFTLSKDNGNINASYWLADLYEKEEFLALKRKKELEEAKARMGTEMKDKLKYLKICYKSEVVDGYAKKALELLMEGEKANHLGATKALARKYFLGEGVEKDLLKAKSLFVKAESLGADCRAEIDKIDELLGQ